MSQNDADGVLEPSTAANPISAYLSQIGRKGGRVGGKASGASKRRTPEHYANMVAARKAKRTALNSSSRSTDQS